MPVNNWLRLQFNFQENDLGTRLVQHIVFNARFAEVGFPDRELRLRAPSRRRHDRHLAGGDGHDHVIHFMDMAPRRTPRRQPPLRDADLGRIDLDVGLSAEHADLSQNQGTKSRKRNIANTTMCTSPNRMLVRPVPKVSMLSTKVRTSSTIPWASSPSTSCLSSA